MVRTEVDYSQTSVTKVTSNILRFSVHRLKVWTTVKYHYTVVKRYLFSLRIFFVIMPFSTHCQTTTDYFSEANRMLFLDLF